MAGPRKRSGAGSKKGGSGKAGASRSGAGKSGRRSGSDPGSKPRANSRTTSKRSSGDGASSRGLSSSGSRGSSNRRSQSQKSRQDDSGRRGTGANDRSRKGGSGGTQSSGRSRGSRASKGLGGDQVEGRQAVRELLLAGRRQVREIFIAEDLAESDVIADIEALSQELGVACRTVSRRRLAAEALTESHQGVIARAKAVEPADFSDLSLDPNAFLVVLDGVTDPGNLGTILRTAECSGVTGVVLGRHRSARVSPTVTKAAAGAVEHVPIAVVGGIPTAVADLKKAGVLTVGLDGAGDSSIFELPSVANGPIALVLGAEGQGLSRLVRERVDIMASIPLKGNLNSLNVAMATAVACFEVVRLRHLTNSK